MFYGYGHFDLVTFSIQYCIGNGVKSKLTIKHTIFSILFTGDGHCGVHKLNV